jgi:O-antigen ligase
VLKPRDNSLPEPLALPWLPRPLLVGGVIAAISLISLLAGRMVAQERTSLVLALIVPPVAVIAAIAAVRYFEMLVLLLPVAALAMRFAVLPTGTASPLPLSLVMTIGLVGIWLVSMWTRRVWLVPRVPFNRSLFLFMAICGLSLPWGILWRDPILNMQVMGNSFPITQTASLMSLIALMWLPWLVGYFIDSEWKIKFYLGTFIACGALMTVTQILDINQIILNDRGLWGLWYAATLFGIILTMPGVSFFWRLFYGILLAFNLYLSVIKNSGWASGWLPIMLALMTIIFLRSRKVFFILAMLGLLIVIVGPGREYLEHLAAEEANEGALERLDIWTRSLGIVSQHWLFGTGPAGYAPYNMTYFPWDARSTHNNFFDIVAQFGVVGLLVWCWFMFASLRFGWKTIGRAPHGLLRTTAIIATSGWGAALCSMMLGDWILPFAYNQGIGGYGYVAYSWIFLGLLVSVHRLLEAPGDIHHRGAEGTEERN